MQEIQAAVQAKAVVAVVVAVADMGWHLIPVMAAVLMRRVVLVGLGVGLLPPVQIGVMKEIGFAGLRMVIRGAQVIQEVRQPLVIRVILAHHLRQ
jgi:hypothetical protein